ncbi:hypothetical protein TSOC_012892 [Tetrabaena socialis]|uniref:1,3-beta-glucan synthase component FKS1-like domain-containing protein n=1 Tax=Tetrabaena socialis TaxID=47790 RepID=A0A2J7ZLU1_9CHLO|nr:hypothetical protein TSOC_012892 [Tetrabaena socialis]|eukprot:PNH01232.1 hypothetical protein TSOC_012892 [Tetrabaena socialis]
MKHQYKWPGNWVPATAFLAADHLDVLLVRNLMPRMAPPPPAASKDAKYDAADDAADADAEAAQQQEDALAFARAVWELHSHIFLPYEGAAGWCRLVGVAARPAAALSEVLGARGAGDASVLHLLLCELSLYFLLYSEAANLRHTPELMWFLFWAAANSPAFEQLWREGPGPEEPLEHARHRRLAMRNVLQSQLLAAQEHIGHDPAACRPGRCAEAAAALESRLPSLPRLGLSLPASADRSPAAEASRADASLGSPASQRLFADLAAHGDGGFWTDTFVAPLFTVLAFEIDHMATAGQEMAHRLGYDDVNESLCRRDVVAKLLEALGVPAAAAAGGLVHGALEALAKLGYASAADEAEGERAQHGSKEPGGESDDPRAFDAVLAAAFWADSVFVKTHRERRSWSALFRAFYRVYSLHFVLLHAIMAHAFAPGSLRVLSSAVVTHAILAAIERTANWWLTRGPRDPLQAAKARDSWVHPAEVDAAAGDAEAATPAPSGPVRSRLSDGGAVEARLARRQRVVVEGAPLWGVFGWLEWVLVAFGVVGLFALQYMGPPAMQTMARSYWPFAAGGYAAAVVGHGLLSGRDGYSVSLSSLLRLPRLFTASSVRPTASCWLERPMAVGWRAALLTAFFWAQVLGAKVAFDYYVIMRPIAGQVSAAAGGPGGRARWSLAAGGSPSAPSSAVMVATSTAALEETPLPSGTALCTSTLTLLVARRGAMAAGPHGPSRASTSRQPAM